MSNALVKQENVVPLATYSREQRELVRKTAFPDSTDDELALFLHVAGTSGLDPLRRQIHPLRLQGRLTFVADINGLQARAARESDFEGLLHAVVYEKDKFVFDHKAGEVLEHASNPFGQNGKPLGAWAICYRKGMRPFVALVRFEEYNNARNPLWASKPSVMIDKCAKSSVLRLAYPEQLGGIYESAELDAVESRETGPVPLEAQRDIKPTQSGTEAATKRLLAAGKGKAKERPAPIRVVDVEPDETEEDATARQSPKLLFGPHRHKPISALTTDQILDSVELAEKDLGANPTSEYAGTLRAQLKLLSAEVDARAAHAEDVPE